MEPSLVSMLPPNLDANHDSSLDTNQLQPANIFFLSFFHKFCFWMWIIFKVFIEFVTILLLVYVVSFFDFEAYGILVSRPEIEPAPAVLEGKVLTPGPPGNSPANIFCDSLFTHDPREYDPCFTMLMV